MKTLAAILLFALLTLKSVAYSNNNVSVPWQELEQLINNTCGGENSTCAGRNKIDPTEDKINARCACDDECWKYGDCCLDAAKNAWQLGKRVDFRWKCQSVPIKSEYLAYSIYMISFCPQNWSDHDIEKKCRRNVEINNYSYIMDLPVVSSATNITYANVFCAICNQDTQLHNFSLEINCPKNMSNCRKSLTKAKYRNGKLKWYIPRNYSLLINGFIDIFNNRTFFLSSTNSRQCQETQDICDQDNKLCSLFAYKVYADSAIIKNPVCAKCYLHDRNISCDYFRSIPTTAEYEVNFSLLLDFNEMRGEYVGVKRRCAEGQVYDPLLKKCFLFYCGQKFKKVGDECVADPEKMAINSTDLVINEPCPKRLITVFVWMNDSSVYINETNSIHSKGDIEFINSTAILICVDEDDEYINKFSIIQSRLSIIITSISVICLGIHILVYSLIPAMRNLPGLNLLSLSSMLCIGQLLLLGVKGVSYFGFCQAMAIAMHYAFLTAFFWMNIMSIDICRTFTTTYHSSKSDCKKNYISYSKYAWIIPAVIVAAAILIDNSNLLPEFRPRYGHQICWITRRKGLLLFFAIPLAILLLENIIFFILTARGIYRTTKATKRATGRQSENIRFILYIKLAAIMGLTWVFGFIASLVDSSPLWYVFIIFNASQGIYIFLAFTLKAKILKLIREQLPCDSLKSSSLQQTQNGGITLKQATSISNLNTTSTSLTSSSLQINNK